MTPRGHPAGGRDPPRGARIGQPGVAATDLQRFMPGGASEGTRAARRLVELVNRSDDLDTGF